MNDDLEPQPVDVRAGVAIAGGRYAQLANPLVKQIEEGEQLVADEAFRFLPGFGPAFLSATKENRVAFQFSDLHWEVYDTGNGLNQFGNDGVAVRQGLGVSGHVTCVTAYIGDDQQYRFRGAFGGKRLR